MRPVVAVQPDGRSVAEVAAPLSIGLARWRGKGEATALVVKATLGFDGDGEEVVARFIAPDPVGKRAPSELAPEVTRYPDDFVQWKRRCDVVLHGHAHSPTPETTIPVEIRIGSFRRSLQAVTSGAPRRSIPLLPAFLRDAGGVTASVGVVDVARETGDEEIVDVDADRFQCAGPEMQLPALSADATIELEGLSVRGRRRVIKLPGLAPLALCEAGVIERVILPLVCDTVHVDTDFERIVLVWRGALPLSIRVHDLDRVIVGLAREEPRAALLGEDDPLFRGLPRGTVSFAIEEHEIEGDPDELELARWEVLEHSADPELPLERYATISAELAEDRPPRAEVLEKHGFDERTWAIEERAWTERLAFAAAEDDEKPVAAFGAAFLAAQDALAGPHEPRPLADYAAIRVALETSERPLEVLREHGIGRGEWARLDRHWQRVAGSDPAVAAELEALLAREAPAS